MRKIIILFFTFLIFGKTMAQEIPLLSNISARNNMNLNGKWSYIVDPLENGYYDYRLMPFKNNGFFENKKFNTTDLTEYNFATSATMDIPSDWNSKDERLFFYEGTVWFQKDFNYKKSSQTKGILHFGAVNYDAKVYVNGKLAGSHIGGYTPFNFDVTNLLVDGNNFVVVKVDNKRHKDNVPTVNMDWWNYGGITRDVTLAQVPNTYIEDYLVQLDKKDRTKISGWIKLNSDTANQSVSITIPELKIKKSIITDAKGMAYFEIKTNPVLWTPEKPKLYDLTIDKAHESIADKIGFRTIETKGKEILLNGKKVFLRGISIHEEAPFRSGRAWSREDAVTLLSWAKELGCNYVRLAHYPHNENMVKEAEKMGLMIWSEVPVYWTISWTNPDTYANAERQLHDMIYRDKNRCGIVIWSIANETPHGDDRDIFLSKLAKYARTQDNSRLISMAMEVTKSPNNVNTLHDNMNEYVDIVSFNQYLGWYRGTNESCKDMQWVIPYNKPVIISEFGGEALQGLHGDKTQRWNEEYQEELYVQNTQMFNRIEGLAGVSPWILVDFRSPRRQLPNIQDFFNRKGLISDQGIKKKAFYVMKDWYAQKEVEYK
ncbi:glycoside hydrolase family 2 TIM barrel-domain containing protein [Flavobacterium sp. CSZ]|uniref:glycoside hydrolase family 2 protein n=1 Tax=Flavobacterium sp. CSZ TaxID=2783791 RepID=UPI001889F1CC|nr:glycoside hydrolase family 2 TIM barrel-domain containing protein [Flavobacterium sp. CSZ]MBF4484384.1 beta-glucuronidase [Flavobacterium sp. CSZ]